MSETAPETPVARRNVDAALARVEAKLDVAIAQHGAKLDEHTRRIAEHSVRLDKHDDRIGQVERAQVANDARDSRDDQNATSLLTRSQAVALWVTIAVMLLGLATTVAVTIAAHR